MDPKKEREHHRKEVCRRFRTSGEMRKTFCQKNGIALSTLGLWLQKERTSKHPSTNSEMVAVGSMKLAKHRRTLRIRTKKGIVIELDLPATEEDIRTVLRVAADL